jgi:hypothetical protein
MGLFMSMEGKMSIEISILYRIRKDFLKYAVKLQMLTMYAESDFNTVAK